MRAANELTKDAREARKKATVCDGAARMLATRGHNLVKANEYAKVKIECEAALGEMLAQMPLSKGALKRGPAVPSGDHGPKLSDIGINKNQSSRWQLIAANAEILPAAVEALVVRDEQIT